MIVQTVGIDTFRDAFRIIPNNFTHDGLGVLFDHIDSISDERHPIELNVIAICCDYAEDSPEHIASKYGIYLPERDDCMDDEDYSKVVRDAVVEYLEAKTCIVGETDETIVFFSFVQDSNQ